MGRVSTAIGAGLIVTTLLVAPQARADDAGFVAQAKALGLKQYSANLIGTARSACYFLTRNRDPGQVRERISRYLAVDAGLASQFFEMSVTEYCPQYLDRVG